MAVSQHGQILLYTRLGEYYLFLTPAFKIQYILTLTSKIVIKAIETIVLLVADPLVSIPGTSFNDMKACLDQKRS